MRRILYKEKETRRRNRLRDIDWAFVMFFITIILVFGGLIFCCIWEAVGAHKEQNNPPDPTIIELIQFNGVVAIEQNILNDSGIVKYSVVTFTSKDGILHSVKCSLENVYENIDKPYIEWIEYRFSNTDKVIVHAPIELIQISNAIYDT